ncbi:hypothetical protein HMF3257_28090 [Spirosoma telluris]|uniref:Uncharacterized protein n=1 Tax=Spirosoma telluris TaxID=2183553 RepID=A0A327NPD4_9BACT|nr:hypothetical protein HMF3257_28090 [Spirosoma telluris]
MIESGCLGLIYFMDEPKLLQRAGPWSQDCVVGRFDFKPGGNRTTVGVKAKPAVLVMGKIWFCSVTFAPAGSFQRNTQS